MAKAIKGEERTRKLAAREAGPMRTVAEAVRIGALTRDEVPPMLHGELDRRLRAPGRTSLSDSRELLHWAAIGVGSLAFAAFSVYALVAGFGDGRAFKGVVVGAIGAVVGFSTLWEERQFRLYREEYRVSVREEGLDALRELIGG